MGASEFTVCSEQNKYVREFEYSNKDSFSSFFRLYVRISKCFSSIILETLFYWINSTHKSILIKSLKITVFCFYRIFAITIIISRMRLQSFILISDIVKAESFFFLT